MQKQCFAGSFREFFFCSCCEAQQALKAIEFDERLSTRMFLLGSCPCAVTLADTAILSQKHSVSIFYIYIYFNLLHANSCDFIRLNLRSQPWPFELHRAHVQRSQQVSRDFCPCRNKGNSSVSLYDFSQFNLKPAECILFMTPCTFCGIDGKAGLKAYSDSCRLTTKQSCHNWNSGCVWCVSLFIAAQ